MMACALCHRRRGHICLICGWAIDGDNVDDLITHQKKYEHTGGHFTFHLPEARHYRPPWRYRSEEEERECDEESGSNVLDAEYQDDETTVASLVDELKSQEDFIEDDDGGNEEDTGPPTEDEANSSQSTEKHEKDETDDDSSMDSMPETGDETDVSCRHHCCSGRFVLLLNVEERCRRPRMKR